MTQEIKVRLAPEFTAYLRIRDGNLYVHRVEHEEITGYSFPRRDENRQILARVRGSYPIDVNYTKKHLAAHADMKF